MSPTAATVGSTASARPLRGKAESRPRTANSATARHNLLESDDQHAPCDPWYSIAPQAANPFGIKLPAKPAARHSFVA